MHDKNEYDLKDLELPRLAGGALRIFVKIMENPLTRPLLMKRLLREAGIDKLRAMRIDEEPTQHPHAACKSPEHASEAETGSEPLVESLLQEKSNRAEGFAFAGVKDYAEAYRSGKTTSEAVAGHVLRAVDESEGGTRPLRAMIACDHDDVMDQAKASTQRFRDGTPLSVFDGVPVAVKDEVDMVPYGTTVGTRFLGRLPAVADATVAARMRAAGALLIGKANMHEIGIGVTGLNPHHGAVRNPYNPDHHTGGSSSGSAAAVAAGLCPVAIGADGGGSIRIPSALCGVYGLKATYGRVSVFGAAPLDWSVGHLGPIAADPIDLALSYAVMAGSDPKDPLSNMQPPVSIDGFGSSDLKGIKLGVYRPWFNHATPPVAEACETMLKALEAMGAIVIDVTIPELDLLRIAHTITIASEMAACMDRYDEEHRTDFGLDVRINLALARSFTARDYLQAQCARTRIIEHFHKALTEVDAIVTPSTGCTAPAIPKDALPDGESNLSVVMQIMRFAAAANFTGLPAVSFPAGYDPQGLPIGFQAIGLRWEERVLLRIAHLSSRALERRRPEAHFPILPG